MSDNLYVMDLSVSILKHHKLFEEIWKRDNIYPSNFRDKLKHLKDVE